MTTPWRSLLWKEWREQWPVLAGLTAVYVAIPVIYGAPDEDFALGMVLILVIPMTSLFLAASVAAGERSSNTDRFVQALPTSMVRPAAAKLLLASLTVVTPIVISMLVFCGWSLWRANPQTIDIPFFERSWGIDNSWVASCVGGSLMGLSLLFWGAAIGVNRSDEIRAGAVTIAVVATLWILSVFIGNLWLRPDKGRSDLLLLAPTLIPGCLGFVDTWRQHESTVSVVIRSWPDKFVLPAALGLTVHGALAARYLSQFGRHAPAGGRIADSIAPSPVEQRGWLGAPRKSTLRATAWKQMRESLPLASVGSAIVLVVAGIITLDQWLVGNGIQNVSEMIVVVTFYVGFLISLIAGVGVFLEDVRPGVDTFWRSRPIQVDGWFWTKYFTALGVTLGLLAIPCLPVLGAILAEIDRNHRNVLPEMLLILLLIDGFGAAAAAMALVRRPLMASVMPLGILGIGAVALAMYDNHGGPRPDIVSGITIALATVGFPVLAWQAVKRDWGWKADQ